MTSTGPAIPVLTYHSVNLNSDEYFRNDHIALYQDLRLIHGMGKRIVPLALAIDCLFGKREDAEVENAVVINFDDGHDPVGRRRVRIGRPETLYHALAYQTFTQMFADHFKVRPQVIVHVEFGAGRIRIHRSHCNRHLSPRFAYGT